MSAHEPAGVVVHDFTSADDAIRAIQGLKIVGFAEHDIDVVAQDAELEQSIRDQAFPEEPEGPISRLTEAVASLVHRLTHHGVPAEVALEYNGKVEAGHILVAVAASGRTDLAHDVMQDGLAYTGHTHATERHSTFLDSSTGSGAGVASSLGTTTGITPGAGYEGNTGSTAGTSPGPLGQFAPGADTPNPDDDFPGQHAQSSGNWRAMTATEANELDYTAMRINPTIQQANDEDEDTDTDGGNGESSSR